MAKEASDPAADDPMGAARVDPIAPTERADGADLVARTVRVRWPDPRTGIHDSLGRIAARELGDPRRWPEIFALNRGRRRPDGGILDRPSRIIPGEQLLLPSAPSGPSPDQSAIAETDEAAAHAGSGHIGCRPSALSPPQLPRRSPSRGIPTGAPRPLRQLHQRHQRQQRHEGAADEIDRPSRDSGRGVRAGRGIFLSENLAALVTAALVLTRRRNDSRFRPDTDTEPDQIVSSAAARTRHAYHRDRVPRTDRIATPSAPRSGELHIGIAAGRDGVVALSGTRHRRYPGPADGGEVEEPWNEDRLVAQLVARLAAVRTPGYADYAVAARIFTTGDAGSVPDTAPNWTPHWTPESALRLPLGMRDGRAVVFDLSLVAGLGVAGGGAAAAARALLLVAAGWDLLEHTPAVQIPALPSHHPPPPASASGTASTTASSTASSSAPRSASTPRSSTTGPRPRTASWEADQSAPPLPELIRVIIAADTAAVLLGPEPVEGLLPPSVRVMAPQEALDLAEQVILARTMPATTASSAAGHARLLLIASAPPPDSTWEGEWAARLQAVLELGAACGVAGLLMGDWRAGASVHVRADGTVDAGSPGVAEDLRDTRLFGIGAPEAVELLGLLAGVYPRPTVRPAAAAPHRPHQDVTLDRDGEPPRTTAPPCPSSPPGATTERSVEPIADPAQPASAAPTGDGALEVTLDAQHDVTLPDTTLAETVAAAPAPATTMTASQRDGAVQPVAAERLRVDVFGPPRIVWRPARPPTTSTALDSTGTDTDQRAVAAAVRQGGVIEADEQEVTAAFQPRTRELLVFLAIHPDGASRDALAAALWPDSPPGRLGNTLHTAFSRLRRAVRTATHGHLDTIVTTTHGRYRLIPELVEGDYTRFAQAQTDRRTATTPQARRAALQAMIDTYAGPLAEGMSATWLDPVREALRRDAVDAVGALARVLVTSDPEQTLELLEIARAFDPFNELLYRDIMRLQARLGRLDAIPRTLTLLTTRLAELDDHPSPATVQLAEHLCQPRPPHRGDNQAAGHFPA